ncbi:hypothetical protein, partial [Escherichia coli]|uniref:hypothetical protein n=1 Tax=Escherichia coli TaxID=562 RepID=UPI001C5323AD
GSRPVSPAGPLSRAHLYGGSFHARDAITITTWSGLRPTPSTPCQMHVKKTGAFLVSECN